MKMKPKKLYRWSSHQPVLKTVLNYFNPELIVELGIGHFSTPILNNSLAQKIIHIENDEAWLVIVRQENIFSEKNDFRYHYLGKNVDKKVRENELSKMHREDLISYYAELKKEIQNLSFTRKFLFVDNHTCARSLAINILYDIFDVIVYHDAEETELYNYFFQEKISNDYDHYVFQPPSSYTGIFCRKGLIDFNNFNNLLKEEFVTYLKTHNFDLQDYNIIKK